MGDTSKAFSSKRNAFVPANDEEFTAWREAGNVTSTTRTVKDLCDTLNAIIDAQIAEIEAGQPRSLRELSIDPSSTFAKNKLKNIDDEIKALRLKRLNPENLEN